MNGTVASKISVLVAGIDETVAEYFRLFDADDFFDIEWASGGLECLIKLRLYHPDVLVLDHQLPWGGADGVLERMREENDIPSVPVVLICEATAELPAGFLGTADRRLLAEALSSEGLAELHPRRRSNTTSTADFPVFG